MAIAIPDQGVGDLRVRVHNTGSVVLRVANIASHWAGDLHGAVWISEGSSLQFCSCVLSEQKFELFFCVVNS